MLIFERFASLLAPHQCLNCGREGNLLCNWCSFEAFEPAPSKCYRCHASTQDFATCPKCRRLSPLSNVWVSTSYLGDAKRLIHLLKFERAKAAALVIAQQMRQTLPYLPEEIVITHVPTATLRRRQRGYDQTELISRALSLFLHKPHLTLLARSGQTRQVGASRNQRLEQLKTAFRANKLADNREILLIDDIVTSGATLESAAKVLKKAGAKKVYGAVFAQKQ